MSENLQNHGHWGATSTPKRLKCRKSCNTLREEKRDSVAQPRDQHIYTNEYCHQ